MSPEHEAVREPPWTGARPPTGAEGRARPGRRVPVGRTGSGWGYRRVSGRGRHAELLPPDREIPRQGQKAAPRVRKRRRRPPARSFRSLASLLFGRPTPPTRLLVWPGPSRDRARSPSHLGTRLAASILSMAAVVPIGRNGPARYFCMRAMSIHRLSSHSTCHGSN